MQHWPAGYARSHKTVVAASLQMVGKDVGAAEASRVRAVTATGRTDRPLTLNTWR